MRPNAGIYLYFRLESRYRHDLSKSVYCPMYQPVPSLGMVLADTSPRGPSRACTVECAVLCIFSVKQLNLSFENILGKERSMETGKIMYLVFSN